MKDIYELFRQHQLWVETFGKEGKQFVFREDKIEDLFLHDQMLTQLVILESDLRNAKFVNMNLDYANFGGTNFSSAWFENTAVVKADVFWAIFADAVLKNVNAFRTGFLNCDFSGANLIGVNFAKGLLCGSNLQGARISGCNFWEASLDDVKGLEDAYIEWIDIGEPKRAHLKGEPQILKGEQARRWLMAQAEKSL